MSHDQSVPSASGDACAICLEVVQLRGGGVPLHSPGCCGKWFHQKCIVDYVNAGVDSSVAKCPSCRSDFEVPPWMRTNVTPQMPAQQVPAAQFQFQQLPVPPPPSSIFGMIPRLFRSAIPTPVAQPAQPIRNNARAARFGGASIFAHPTEFVEDLLPEINVSTDVSTVREQNIRDLQKSISITMTPEYDVIGLSAAEAFSVRVGLQYNENVATETSTDVVGKSAGDSPQTGKLPAKETAVPQSTVGLDIVCILDNSGSMTGSKLESLKTAMKFVIQSLGSNDR